MSNDGQSRIAELEQEIHDLYDVIEQLQEEIMKKDVILQELDSADGSSEATSKALQSKQGIDLEVKGKEIRELKNKLGHMRKEKIQIQQELEKFKKQKTSTVIPIEKIRRKEQPLQALVDDLQRTVAKLRVENKKLKSGGVKTSKSSSKDKEKEIESLKLDIIKLKNQQKSAPIKGGAGINSDLTAELQSKLNKARRQIDILKKKLIDQESGTSKKKKKNIKGKSPDIDDLYQEIEDLKKQLALKPELPVAPVGNPISGLTSELQEKLNKARTQIKSYQGEIRELKGSQVSKEVIIDNLAREKLEDELTDVKETLEVEQSKTEMLQKKIDEQAHILTVKEQRIITLTEKAKTQEISVVNGIDEKSPVALRLRELSGIVDELKKQNVQQRLEIFSLKK